MTRVYILWIAFLCGSFAHSQKKLPNPKIGKNEIEVGLFNLYDMNSGSFDDRRQVLGAHFVYRWPWKKYTKAGAGFLGAADYSSGDGLSSDVVPYGVVFVDITQFIGAQQKWSIGGEAGPSFYKREYDYNEPNLKSSNKYSGGMYYSISCSYREVISKKTLFSMSLFWALRNFRNHRVTEYSSPPYIEEYNDVQAHSGLGVRFGFVF